MTHPRTVPRRATETPSAFIFDCSGGRAGSRFRSKVFPMRLQPPRYPGALTCFSQTEAPSAARKKQQIEPTLCRAHPELRGALEYDIRDEIAHARIGKTWLAHLLPGRIEQRRAIALTDRLRSLLILTSFAHHHNTPLSQLIDQCLCGRLRAA
jgi:hypothetical protein